MIGQTLDHYRIESKLGEGGMGVVYKARDMHLDRSVAAKVLPPSKVADPGRKERFVREARAASALNHPNIVSIYDIRSEGGVDFIVMEYIEGRTLDELIPSKGMRVAQALTYSLVAAARNIALQRAPVLAFARVAARLWSLGREHATRKWEVSNEASDERAGYLEGVDLHPKEYSEGPCGSRFARSGSSGWIGRLVSS